MQRLWWLTPLVCAVLWAAGCNGREQPDRRSASASTPSPAPSATEPSDTSSPEQLLRTIFKLAANKRYDEIAPHLLPLKLPVSSLRPAAPAGADEVEDLRERILRGIRQPETNGPYAYSHQALLTILTHHLGRIGPVPQAMLDAWAEGKGLGQDAGLHATARDHPRALQCLNHAGAFVLMQKKGRRFYLLCWRGLGNLLGEAATQAASQWQYIDLDATTVKLKDGRFVMASLSLAAKSPHANAIRQLLQKRRQDVGPWLTTYFSALSAADLTGEQAQAKRLAEIREGLNRLLQLPPDGEIESVVARDGKLVIR